MSIETLDRVVSSFLNTDQPSHSFAWQGGEPLIMGVDFLRNITDSQIKFGRKGTIVSNGLQTNGTLITDEIAAHLKEYKFLVGVSLDGPREIHDTSRYDATGRGSHRRVFAGIETLRKHKVEFNILTLVHAGNVRSGRKIFRYLCEKGFAYQQYIPCVEFDVAGKPFPHTVSGEEWGAFLCDVFDEWLKRGASTVSIRLFDSILGVLTSGVSFSCQMDSNCCQYFVVEHNGDVYPCDFFVEKKLRLGNILETDWEKLLSSDVYKNFGAQKVNCNIICRECEYAMFCSGDCLKYRFHGSTDPQTLSWLCKGWKMFYQHALPEFKRMTLNEQK